MSKSLIHSIVSKSHELIKANYSMTVNEQRLILAAISQINSLEGLLDPNKKFIVTVPQFQEIFSTDANKKNAYRDMKEAAEALFDREARIALPDNKELLTRFVQSILFNSNENQVELRFAVEITPYLSNVYNKFTKYRIQYVAHLTSIYAIRIYELLVTWFGRDGTYTQNRLEIIELREMLDILDKYSQFGELKSRVIDPAIEQINKNTDFIVSVEFIKHKRAYRWIEFNFERKPEIFEADKKAREARQKEKEHNEQARINRLKEEQEKREREQTLRDLEEQQALNEQRAAAERELQEKEQAEKKDWAIALFNSLDEVQKQELLQPMLQENAPAYHDIIKRDLKEGNLKNLISMHSKSFYNALSKFDSPEQAEIKQPDPVSHDDAAIRADALQMFKDGLISKEELAILLKNKY